MVNSLAKNSSFSSGVGPFCHYENSAVLLQVVEDLGEGEFSSGTLREGFVKDYVFRCDLARRHGGLFLPASRRGRRCQWCREHLACKHPRYEKT